MPKRMLSDAICTSENMAAISMGAELLHVHLITQVDDYGRYYAHPSLVRAACFPLRPEITDAHVATWLTELVAVGTLMRYTSGSREYLCFVNWLEHNRPRADSSKFPAPPTVPVAAEPMQAHDNMCKHLPESANICEQIPPKSESESESESYSESKPEPESESKRASAPAPAAPPDPAPQTKPETHPEFWQAFKRHIGILTPDISREADALLNELAKLGAPSEWGVLAVSEAVTHQKQNWAYVRSILRRCAQERRPPGSRPESVPKSNGRAKMPPAVAAARIVAAENLEAEREF